MILPLNLEVNNKMSGVAGDFGPDADGDFAVAGRKMAWRDQTVNYKTIKLTDVKAGDDLSGATINFNPNNLPLFLNPDAGLSNFQWVVWSGTSGAGLNIHVAWNANSIQDGAMNYIYNVPSGDLTVPNWLEDTYTFPENSIVTDMYDLGGNRQTWDDVVAGCDPSGWNPSMATVRVRVAPVDTVDSVTKQDSPNLITSGGVWNDTHYIVVNAGGTKTLAQVAVGEDLSGVTLNFPGGTSDSPLGQINFSNGYYIGFRAADNISWGLCDSAGQLDEEWAVTGHMDEGTTYTFGTGFVVSAVDANNAGSNISQLITYEAPASEKIIDIPWLYNKLMGSVSAPQITSVELADLIADSGVTPGQMFYVTDATTQYQTGVPVLTIIKPDGTPEYLISQSELAAHSNYDLTMIREAVAKERAARITQYNEFITFKNSVLNHTLGTPVDIEASMTSGYTVDNELGGMIDGTGLNVLLTTWSIMKNGTSVDNGTVLNLGTEPFSFEVKNGDVITGIGITAVTFTPYVPA